ncbi:hypothetical protein AB1Y20_013883 [Prymnesium parvum]|uniref:DUF6816 domain-containing protein n=1 Tax=Prymnesium parvum TaxID=97485 RepID=A0AB34IE79_PRYPA
MASLCLLLASAPPALTARPQLVSRRAALFGLGACHPTLHSAAAAQLPSLRATLHTTRNDAPLSSSLIARPAYGVQAPDVYYPEWALGRWKVTSTLSSVRAPLGTALFAPRRNGTAALLQAREEIGKPLRYEARWRRDAEGRVVVDRRFCVESISRAAMGEGAVQEAEEDGPNHLIMYLTPSGAGGALYRADLNVVARRVDEQEGEGAFACAETTRQTIVLVPSEKYARATPPPPLIKEVETICTYDRVSRDVIQAEQRTATFLVGDALYTGEQTFAEQQAGLMSRRSDGTMLAVDLRHYDLKYERI